MPLGLFLPPGNHLPIQFVVSLQICNLIFLRSLLSSILCICSLQFILYCVNLSLILKIPNRSLTSLFLFLSQSVQGELRNMEKEAAEDRRIELKTLEKMGQDRNQYRKCINGPTLEGNRRRRRLPHWRKYTFSLRTTSKAILINSVTNL